MDEPLAQSEAATRTQLEVRQRGLQVLRNILDGARVPVTIKDTRGKEGMHTIAASEDGEVGIVATVAGENTEVMLKVNWSANYLLEVLGGVGEEELLLACFGPSMHKLQQEWKSSRP